MHEPDETIHVPIPLKVRTNNRKPRIVPPAKYRQSEDQAHVKTNEFAKIQELAEAVRFAELQINRQLRFVYLAREAPKGITYPREPSAASKYDLSCLAWDAWR